MPARFDRRLISQALTNIIKNATEAIAAVPPAELGTGSIRVSAARDGDDVVIDVIDNGIGLPKENRSRLLEPYVTTREKGTGLGLAIVGRIIEEHGGRIELRDAADKIPGQRGAWVRLRFAAAGHVSAAPNKQDNSAERVASWPPIFSSSTTKPISANWSPASCRTRATARAPRATATTRWPRSPRAAESGLPRHLAAGLGSTACSCSTPSNRSIPKLPVVMISGHGNIETAVAAIKRGAYDFIEKPFKADRLVLVADRALETSRLKREVKQLKQLAPLPPTLIGRSPAINQLRQTIEKVAPTNSRILIVGPSGSGKELAARTHPPALGPRQRALRRHQRRGDHAGAHGNRAVRRRPVERRRARKVGALEEAHGGTLFIDEIADMPRETQNKILRVLVDQTFQRVGGNRPRSRSTCASSRRPRAISKRRSPRASSARTSITACRWCRSACRRSPSGARTSPIWSSYFMEQISLATGLPKRRIGEDAMAVLQSHDWPGNVRQLRNNVERLMILAGGDPDAVITASMLPPDVGSMVPAMPNGNGGEQLMGLPLREAREVFEREYLVAQISRFGGNISRTAEFVGMERSALHRKLKALGIG